MYSKHNTDVKSFQKILVSKNIFGILLFENSNLVTHIISKKSFDQADIIEISTNPKFYRKGYASKALKVFEKLSSNKGIKFLFLEVNVKNKLAMNCYLKSNFVEIGLRKNYYRNSKNYSDAIIMKKIVNKQISLKKEVIKTH